MRKGCYQETIEKDDAYASTPLFVSLNLLLLVGLWENYSFNTFDVCTGLLHAELKEEMYVRPPSSSTPNAAW